MLICRKGFRSPILHSVGGDSDPRSLYHKLFICSLTLHPPKTTLIHGNRVIHDSDILTAKNIEENKSITQLKT